MPVATIRPMHQRLAALTGSAGLAIGIDHYGASAPGGVNGEKFGFTVAAVTAKIEAWLG